MASVSSPAQAGAVPTPSPIVRVLNEEVRHYHRWCTPSTLMDQERVEDFYESDVSISAGFFGTLVDHTGVFGEAERFAASAQGADRTMFSVHGSSGSNWIVLRMLALERPDALVLVVRAIGADPPRAQEPAPEAELALLGERALEHQRVPAAPVVDALGLGHAVDEHRERLADVGGYPHGGSLHAASSWQA
jgi:hypothetical protein